MPTDTTKAAVRPSRLTIDGSRFRDAAGRQVILRGVNLGGDNKTPASPDGATWRPTDFSDHRTVSFVGRPFPLAEADAHLGRIAAWGFNGLRLLTTWEAVEHADPGVYDEAYLDHLRQVCIRAGGHGLRVFIDFHQDVWSRMSGGDGAPGWTFEAVGLDFTRFDAADAAHLMQHRYDPALGGRQPSYPQMSWASNYRMPANAIMWTLFFGGEAVTPDFRIEGVNAGRWLRNRYLGAVGAVAARLADLDHVIGFDTLNEPSLGWIGRALEDPGRVLSGPAWTPLDALAAASGRSRTLPVHTFGQGATGQAVLNPDGVSIWLPGREDPFRAHGVWDLSEDGEPIALRPDAFQRAGGQDLGDGSGLLGAFFNEVADAVRAVRDDWLIFAEVDPFAALTQGHGFPADSPERTVNASHWYDLAALVTKRFDPERGINLLTGEVLSGRDAIEASYVQQLSRLLAISEAVPGGMPTLIGEFGIPFDLHEGEAYDRWAAGERSSDLWAAQAAALELMYNALDRLLLNSTQWNYTASNRNDPMIGDGWNQEDLSIWSPDQLTRSGDDADGARGLEGFRRPFAHAVQGDLLSQAFDRGRGRFEIAWTNAPELDAPTLVYLPPLGVWSIEASEGLAAAFDGPMLQLRGGPVGPVSLTGTLAAEGRDGG